MPEETVSAVLAEMMAAAKSNELFDGEEVGEPLIRGTCVAGWADRIEAATARNAKTFWNMLEGAAAAMDGMREERDRAAKYADAAPHPGSASWKEMQAAFAAAKERKPKENYGNVAELRKTLDSIECLCAVVDHYDDPEREEHLADAILEILAKVRLSRAAAPPRNCDKYSLDNIKEMDRDFGAFCHKFPGHCTGCPIKPMDNLCCHSAWMLMPAEGGAS